MGAVICGGEGENSYTMEISLFEEIMKRPRGRISARLPQMMHQHQKQQLGCKHVLLRDGDYRMKRVKHTVAWGVHII